MAAISLVFALLVFSSVFSSSALARPSTASSTNLGTANDYNVFVFQSGTLETGGSQIEGRLAVGGEARTKNYSIASLVPASDSQVPYNVVFGGNGNSNGTTWSGTIYGSIISNGATTTIKTPDVRGSVYAIKALDLGGSTNTGGTVNGNARYGTTFRKDSNVTVTGQTQQGTSTLPFSFASAESDLRAISTRLKNLAATGTTTFQYGGITCTGSNAGLNVFNVSIANLNSCNSLTINVPAGATAVLNITGSGTPVMQNFGITLNGTDAGKVLYHFPDATSVGFGTSGGIEVKGSVLAPNAAVNFGNGQIGGTLVCNSLTATGLFKHVPFTGNLTSSAPVVLSSLTVSPASVVGGQQNATGMVTLSDVAPAGGATVTLSSSNNTVGSVPVNVTVPPGSVSATFTIITTAVTTSTPLSISASYGGVGKSAPLTVNPPPVPTVLSFVVSPASVIGGGTATATVTLSAAAPVGGAVVSLTSSNTAVATLPASVTIAAGATTATATVTTMPVASSTNVTLTASYNSTSATATLTVTPPTLVSVAVSPGSVKGGVANATGTVTLSGKAPTGGMTVTLSSSNAGAATVPASVTVAAGSTTGTFTVTSKSVAADANVTISATLSGVTRTATLLVQAPALQSVSVSPSSIAGGQLATGTITLDAPAPSGGMSVTLSSSSTKATVPTSVMVSAGATTATFTVNTVAVATDTTATLTGTLNGSSKTADLTITAPTLVSVSVNPASVVGGNAATGTVTISSVAPVGGLTVTLQSSDSHATVPASVSVAAGEKTATFAVSTTALAPGAMNVDATITGTLNAASKTAILTVIAPPALPKVMALVINPKITDPADATKMIGSVIGGDVATGTLTLDKAAPVGGIVVTLSSSLPGIANNPVPAQSPWTVTVPEGQSSVDFSIATVPVAGDTKAVITATVGGGSANADLLVRAPAIASLTLDPMSVLGGTGSTGTVTLDGNAPDGGLVVSLQSSDTNTATVPVSVTVAAGTNSATFAVSTVVVTADKSVIITGQTATTSNYPAGATRVTNQNATLVVTAQKTTLVSLVVTPASVTGGDAATAVVTVSPAPTADLTISLTSSSDKATLDAATITIPAGATTGQVGIKTVPVASDTVATITATLGSDSKTATLTILAPVLESVTLNPSTVLGGRPTTGTVTLSGKAPAGGITVALSSSEPNKAKLSSPASITVPAGETSAAFSVQTVPVATQTVATITGTLHGTAKTANLTIRPPSLLSVTVDPSSVKGGVGSTGTVTISGTAPAGGISIALASDKTSASVPGNHSVTVAAGAKTATFAITTNSVASTEVATITGTLNGTSQSAKLTVLPSGISANGDLLLRLVITPKSILSGGTATGEVTLLSAATGQPLVVTATEGATITLTSNKPDSVVSSLPPQVIIPAGKSSTAFTLVGGRVTETVTATITATYSGATASDTLTVTTEPCGGTEKPVPAELTFTPASITGGVPQPLTGTVRLSTVAPAGGMLVRLSAQNESLLIFPRYVWVRSGEDTVTFSVKTKAVAASTNIAFAADAHGTTVTSTVTLIPGIENGGTGGNGITGGPTLTPAAIARGFRMTTFLSGLNTNAPNVSNLWVVPLSDGNVLFRSRAVSTLPDGTFGEVVFPNQDYQTISSGLQFLHLQNVSDATSFLRSGGSLFSIGGGGGLQEWDESSWTIKRTLVPQYALRGDSNWDVDLDPRTGKLLSNVYRIDLTTGAFERYLYKWGFSFQWEDGITGGGTITANEDGTRLHYSSGQGFFTFDPDQYVEVGPGRNNNVILNRYFASRIGTGVLGGKGYWQQGNSSLNYGELWETDLATGDMVKIIGGGLAPKGLYYDDEGNLWVCFLDRIMRLHPPTGGYFGRRYPEAIYTRDDSTGQNHAALSLTAPSNLEATVFTAATFDLSGIAGRVTDARALRTGLLSSNSGAARLDAQFGVRSGISSPVTSGDDPLLSWADTAYSSLEAGLLPLSYNNEWELSNGLQREIQQNLSSSAYPLKLITRVTGVCGDPQVTDTPNAGWPRKKNLLTVRVSPLGLPSVPPGRCLDITLPRTTYVFSTAGATWEIYAGQALVASSVAANGWDVEDDHTFYRGVHVTVPASTVAGAYEVRFNGVAQGAGNFLVTSTESDTAPVLKPLHLSNASIAGGTQTQLVVTLDKPAPVGGATVALSVTGSPAALTIPDRVVIAAGETSGNVLVGSVSGAATFYIHASYNGFRVTRLDVDGGAEPPTGITLTAFSIVPSIVTGGTRSTGTITLSAPAPEGGVRVALAESDPSLVPLPASVLVPAGYNSVSFAVPTVAVTEQKTVTVSATYGGVTIPATIMLLPQGEPPTVKITDPKDGDVFTVTAPATTANISVTVEATSNTPSVAIAKVEVFADGSKIGEASNSGSGSNNNTFTLTWTGVPQGTHKLSARATDAQGRTASTGNVSILVTDKNVAPKPVITPVSGSYPGSFVSVTITDSLAGATIRYTIDGTDPKSSRTAQRYSGPFLVTQSGTTVKARAIKAGYEISGQASESYTLSGGNGGGGSTGGVLAVKIVSPADGGTVTQPTLVNGTVTAPVANNVTTAWELSVRSAGSDDSWQVLSSGTTVGGTDIPVEGRFDPTLRLNGAYNLRLIAATSDGRYAEDIASVIVEGNMKVGNYHIAFNDLTIPVAGIPITVIRSYDTLDKDNPGDFGNGWTLQVSNIKLQKSVPVDSFWEQRRTGNVGALNSYYELRQNKKHFIAITFPNGQVMKFAAIYNPQLQQFAPIDNARLDWVPVGTTRGTLKPVDLQDTDPRQNNVFVVPDGSDFTYDLDWLPAYLMGYDDFVYNPDLWELTTLDGTVMHISERDGLVWVREPNGNELTIGKNGIHSSRGIGVDFSRDGLGRITTIRDTKGNFLRYQVDGNGDLTGFTDRENATTSFKYDNEHNLSSIIDALGRGVIAMDYSLSTGRLTSSVLADGATLSYQTGLDDSDIPVDSQITTDPMGNKTVATFNSRGNVTSQTRYLNGRAITTSATYTDALNPDSPTSITDALGATARFTYSATGEILTVTNASGIVSSRRTYDSAGRLRTATDASGNVITEIICDVNGNPLTYKDVFGNKTEFSYNGDGTVLAAKNQIGDVTRFSYDNAGRLIGFVDSVGRITNFERDEKGNITARSSARTLPSGQNEIVTTHYIYNANDQLVKLIYPDGFYRQLQYDPTGALIAVGDSLGNVIRFEYDELGKPIRRIFPDGSTVQQQYDKRGLKICDIDQLGRQYIYDYDSLGRPISTQEYDSSGTLRGISAATYDDNGRVLTLTDPLGHTQRKKYDILGRLQQYIDPTGVTVGFEYDIDNRLISIIDSQNHENRISYDLGGQVIERQGPDGNSVGYSYDNLGRVQAVTMPTGRTLHYTYDGAGRISKYTDGGGNVTAFTYDELNNLIARTDALNRTVRFEYDNRGRMTRRWLPLGQKESWTFESDGSIASHTDFNGFTTSYQYDDKTRQLTRVQPDIRRGEPATDYTYTVDGLLSRAVQGSQQTVLDYDGLGRLNNVRDSGGLITYGYDASGNRLFEETASGRTDYAYDAANRITRVKAGNNVTDLSYDSLGRIALINRSNGIATTYDYNIQSQIRSLHHSTGVTYSYTYDQDGRRASVSNNLGTTYFSYDAAGRLASEQNSALGRTDYTYDAVGNRLQKLSPDGNYIYHYDDNDRLSQMDKNGIPTLYQYDDSGNCIAAGNIQLGYDYNNQLQLVGDCSFIYDALGIRVKQSANGHTTFYKTDINNGLPKVVEERDGDSGQLTARYSILYGNTAANENQNSIDRWPLYDAQGNVIALTDSSGTVTDQYSYDAFGNPTHLSGTSQQAHLFRGEQFDSTTGLYYLRARYYDPQSGRFLSRDPLIGNQENPYAFAQNDPVNFHDPSGLFSFSEQMTVSNLAPMVRATVNKIGPQIIGYGLAGAAICGGIDIATQLYITGKIDWLEVSESAGYGALYGALTPIMGVAGTNAATWYIRALGGKGAYDSLKVLMDPQTSPKEKNVALVSLALSLQAIAGSGPAGEKVAQQVGAAMAKDVIASRPYLMPQAGEGEPTNSMGSADFAIFQEQWTSLIIEEMDKGTEWSKTLAKQYRAGNLPIKWQSADEYVQTLKDRGVSEKEIRNLGAYYDGQNLVLRFDEVDVINAAGKVVHEGTHFYEERISPIYTYDSYFSSSYVRFWAEMSAFGKQAEFLKSRGQDAPFANPLNRVAHILKYYILKK